MSGKIIDCLIFAAWCVSAGVFVWFSIGSGVLACMESKRSANKEWGLSALALLVLTMIMVSVMDPK